MIEMSVLAECYKVIICVKSALFSVFQAPKKAKRRAAAGGDSGSSNVFSMFEQSQIQEYKEVRLSQLLPQNLNPVWKSYGTPLQPLITPQSLGCPALLYICSFIPVNPELEFG